MIEGLFEAFDYLFRDWEREREEDGQLQILVEQKPGWVSGMPRAQVRSEKES